MMTRRRTLRLESKVRNTTLYPTHILQGGVPLMREYQHKGTQMAERKGRRQQKPKVTRLQRPKRACHNFKDPRTSTTNLNTRARATPSKNPRSGEQCVQWHSRRGDANQNWKPRKSITLTHPLHISKQTPSVTNTTFYHPHPNYN